MGYPNNFYAYDTFQTSMLPHAYWIIMRLNVFDAIERISLDCEVVGQSTAIPTFIPRIETAQGINL
jgi:hypothetical protein